MEGKVLTLSGNVIALRIEFMAEQQKIMSYLKMLSKQMCKIKNDLDYICAYLDIEVKNDINMNDESGYRFEYS